MKQRRERVEKTEWVEEIVNSNPTTYSRMHTYIVSAADTLMYRYLVSLRCVFYLELVLDHSGATETSADILSKLSVSVCGNTKEVMLKENN